MSKTGIEWTDETHSIQRGCDPVSPGCAHCWAAAMAARFSAPGEAFAGLAKRKALPGGGVLAVWTDAKVRLLPDKLLDLLSWRKPKRVFINSVSDTFHADVPFEYIAALWAFMALAPTVTFQIVTKRAARMREFFEWTAANGGPDHWRRCALDLCRRQIAAGGRDTHRWMKASKALEVSVKPAELALPNVWLLVSTENQETYDERVAELLLCPAVVRGVSAEPLLGPIDLGLGRWVRTLAPDGRAMAVRKDRIVFRPDLNPLAQPVDLPDIDWAIIGGESGAGCRPCELQWLRDLTYQITEYNLDREDSGYTAPFLKQLGGAAVDRPNGLVGARHPAKPTTDPWVRVRLSDGHGGDEAEFPASLCGYRRFPVPRIPGQRGAPLSRPAGQLGLAI